MPIASDTERESRMSYGLQISASGLMAALYRQDVFANNLANLDSIGFKPDVPSSYARPAVREEDNLPFLPSNALLEKLGGGAMLNPNRISFAQGSIRTTGSPLDLAIEGDGFFAVRDAGSASPLLTRDGRFTQDASGRLVMATSGNPVLDVNDRPVVLDPQGAVRINGDGSIVQAGRVVARLRFVQVADESVLRKVGHGQFEVPADALRAAGVATGTIRQGALEESAVDEIKALLQMTGAAREVDANVELMRQHDRLSERAIASLGRVV